MVLLFRDRVDVRNEFHAAHERLQSTGNSQALLLLVRLNNATHCALRCAESAVEHVAELDRIVALLTMPTFDVERTSLPPNLFYRVLLYEKLITFQSRKDYSQTCETKH